MRGRKEAWSQALALCAIALGVRAFLAPRFFGWEEGDYGDLMMVREVLDSGFTWFRVAHMPMWYVLGAVMRVSVPDARDSALLLTMASSVITVGLVTAVARRCFGPGPGWVAGLLLAFQPESALYGASTLREPLFASFGVGALAAVVWGRERLAAGLLGLAFLTRMEAFFTWMPAWCVSVAWILRRPRRDLLIGSTALLGPVLAWQAYVTLVHSEGPFFAAPLGVNLQGGDGSGPPPLSWLRAGLSTVWALLTWTLPRKLGLAWLCLAAWGAGHLVRGHLARRESRVILGVAAPSLALWLAEGLLAQHEPNHNLYWTWLLPVVPFLALCAAAGWSRLELNLPAVWGIRPALAAVWVVAGMPDFVHETRYQMDRAARWYRPQLDLARWIEDELPAGSSVLTSSIPECWLRRDHGPVTALNWWKDTPESLRGAPPEAFGRWLVDAGISYVMWFREDWTDASAVAPYLAQGNLVEAGPVRLVPLDREDEYGWILFGVEAGDRAPIAPPRFGAGTLGRGWD